MSSQPILLHVLPETSNEQPELEKLTESLTAEIAEHDVESVRLVEAADIRVTRATSTQQEKLVNEWLERHAPS